MNWHVSNIHWTKAKSWLFQVAKNKNEWMSFILTCICLLASFNLEGTFLECKGKSQDFVIWKRCYTAFKRYCSKRMMNTHMHTREKALICLSQFFPFKSAGSQSSNLQNKSVWWWRRMQLMPWSAWNESKWKKEETISQQVPMFVCVYMNLRCANEWNVVGW